MNASPIDQAGEPGEPVVLPALPTQGKPSSGIPPEAGEGDGLLQEVLPEISALARRVGGFKRLSEIVEQLDRLNPR